MTIALLKSIMKLKTSRGPNSDLEDKLPVPYYPVPVSMFIKIFDFSLVTHSLNLMCTYHSKKGTPILMFLEKMEGIHGSPIPLEMAQNKENLFYTLIFESPA
jgi:hypothetical protein